jgi:hypothetical protein
MSEVSSVEFRVDVEFKACDHCTFFVLEKHFNPIARTEMVIVVVGVMVVMMVMVTMAGIILCDGVSGASELMIMVVIDNGGELMIMVDAGDG